MFSEHIYMIRGAHFLRNCISISPPVFIQQSKGTDTPLTCSNITGILPAIFRRLEIFAQVSLSQSFIAFAGDGILRSGGIAMFIPISLVLELHL